VLRHHDHGVIEWLAQLRRGDQELAGNEVRPDTSGSVGKAACSNAAGAMIATAATIQRHK
jgi:hypothetical protein